MRSTLIITAAAIVSLISPTVIRAAEGGCHTYDGPFTAVRPTICTSPVHICTHGTLTGDFPSTYDFTVDTLTAIGPNQAGYTGHDVITATNGAQLFGLDSGVLTFVGPGTASFVTTVQIVGGTRQYAHATGSFVAPGVLDLATGATSGSYSATICLGHSGD